MKRSVYILLLIALVLLLAGCNASAPKGDSNDPYGDGSYQGEYYEGDYTECFDFEWRADEQGYYVYEKEGNTCVDLVIPSEYKGMPVIGIGKYAFSSYSKVRSVVVPSTVTVIESYAFSYCDYLTRVEFAKGSALTEINDYAFNNCKILSEIYIPASVEKIGYRAFSTCPKLGKISIDADNGFYCEADGCVYTKDMKTLVSVPPTVSVKEFTVRDGVESIFSGAFRDCDEIEIINLPASVKSIGAHIVGKYIKEIRYAGTNEEWAEVDKAEKWNQMAPDCKIVCEGGAAQSEQ